MFFFGGLTMDSPECFFGGLTVDSPECFFWWADGG